MSSNVFINFLNLRKSIFLESTITRDEDLSKDSKSSKNHFGQIFEQSLKKTFGQNSLKFSPKVEFKFDDDEDKDNALRGGSNPEPFTNAKCSPQSQHHQLLHNHNDNSNSNSSSNSVPSQIVFFCGQNNFVYSR
jgi:hypothetical protein